MIFEQTTFTTYGEFQIFEQLSIFLFFLEIRMENFGGENSFCASQNPRRK